MAKPKIVACINLKGGVGKTAIATNFAGYCSRKGMSTLLVDLDPQTNATFSCISIDDWQEHAAKNGTVADLFGVRSHTSAEGKQKSLGTIILKKVWKNLDLIPSHVELFTIDLELAGATARVDKQKWVELIRENGFPIEIRPRDASRDIFGKLCAYLEENPQAQEKLKASATKTSGRSSPELMKALDTLLKGQRNEPPSQ